MQTDRNLLFGVLAFQDEYIDLAQLAAICRAWAADKSRSIPQLLVERQWLSASAKTPGLRRRTLTPFCPPAPNHAAWKG